MELFSSFTEAREALENAYKVMSSEDKTEVQKLMAFATAMRAEKSIELLEGYAETGSDSDIWERNTMPLSSLESCSLATTQKQSRSLKRRKKKLTQKSWLKPLLKFPKMCEKSWELN